MAFNSPSPQVARARARVGALSRSRASDDAEYIAARRDLTALSLAEYVERVVAQAPPLTPSQRDVIATLLKPAGGGV